MGKIYDKIGFPADGSCSYFKNLVLRRLVYPGSELKIVEYFNWHLNINVSIHTIYRFLDELKSNSEQISFEYTKKLLGGNVGWYFMI